MSRRAAGLGASRCVGGGCGLRTARPFPPACHNLQAVGICTSPIVENIWVLVSRRAGVAVRDAPPHAHHPPCATQCALKPPVGQLLAGERVLPVECGQWVRRARTTLNPPPFHPVELISFQVHMRKGRSGAQKRCPSIHPPPPHTLRAKATICRFERVMRLRSASSRTLRKTLASR